MLRGFIIAAALFVVGLLGYSVYSESTANDSGDAGSDSGASGSDSGGGSLLPTSGTFSLSDLAWLWTAAGGDPSKANTAAAIALAESSGNPAAYNPNDPHGGSFGLWQINGAHGDLASFDVWQNVKAAIQISGNGSNWRPWGAFTNGSYRKYLGGGNG